MEYGGIITLCLLSAIKYSLLLSAVVLSSSEIDDLMSTLEKWRNDV